MDTYGIEATWRFWPKSQLINPLVIGRSVSLKDPLPDGTQIVILKNWGLPVSCTDSHVFPVHLSTDSQDFWLLSSACSSFEMPEVILGDE
ncbi:MAG: hypothetical protein WC518_04125 [Patescibacteria group bacterium]